VNFNIVITLLVSSRRSLVDIIFVRNGYFLVR